MSVEAKKVAKSYFCRQSQGRPHPADEMYIGDERCKKNIGKYGEETAFWAIAVCRQEK